MKVGDTVVCIVDGGWWNEEMGDVCLNPHPIKDKLYEVLETRVHHDELFIALVGKEARDTDGEYEYYQAAGFRKVEPVRMVKSVTTKLAEKALRESRQVDRLDIPKRELELV